MPINKHSYTGTRADLLMESGLSEQDIESLLKLTMKIRDLSGLGRMQALMVLTELGCKSSYDCLNLAATLSINTMSKFHYKDRQTLASWIEAVMEGVTECEKGLEKRGGGNG